MKKLLSLLILTLAVDVLADGPIIQVSPFMQPVLNSQNQTAAQTALGLAGALSGATVTNWAIGANAPIFITTSNGLNAGVNATLTGFQPTYNGVQGLSLWLSAQQQYFANPSLTNGQPLFIQDFSPSNCVILSNVNSSATVQFDSAGMNGTPGLFFPASGAQLEISNFWKGVTSFTMEITYRDFSGTNQITYLAQAGGWGVNQPYCFRLSPWVDGQYVPSTGTGGSLYFATQTNGTFLPMQGETQAPYLPHVFIFEFDGTNAHSYFDGYMTMDSTIQPIANYGFQGMLVPATNLYVGGQITGGNDYYGDISDLKIYKNNSSPALLQNLLQQSGTSARLPVNSLILSGDSIGFSLYTGISLGGWNQLLNAYLPGVDINVVAASGRTSDEEVTNSARYGQCKNTGKNVAIHYIDVNDFVGLNVAQATARLPITLANDTNIFMRDFSNNITPIFCTLASCYFETNGFRTNLNAIVRSWTNIGVLIIDIGATPIGTNGAYANTNFFPVAGGQLHPGYVGYQIFTNATVPVVQQAFYGYPNVFKGPTVNIPQGNALLYNGANAVSGLTNGGNLSIYLAGAGDVSAFPNTSANSIGAGNGTLAQSTNDNSSVALGNGALANMPGGTGNIAVGWAAMFGSTVNQSRSVAIGYFDQEAANSDGNGGNTSMGSGALENLSNGHADTAIGGGAGSVLTTGTYDLYLGSSTAEPAVESGVTRIGTPGQTTIAYIVGTVCGPQGEFTNGIGSFATGSCAFSSTGITNTLSVQLKVVGFVGSGCFDSNTLSGKSYSLAAVDSVAAPYILQPGEAIIGSSCTEVTNIAW